MAPRSVFILADDLSGAADCAIGAAKAGLDSVVLLDADAPDQGAAVLAVDSDSRYRPVAEAKTLSAGLWRRHAAPGHLLYKKIDSTLRGNFAAEMAALTDAGVAIVAPAFPATGRTTEGGRVFVKGVALEQTEVWASEHMQGQADIVAMLQAAGVPALSLPLSVVRGGGLRAGFERQIAGGAVQAIVCDAVRDADLAAIAAASVGLPVYWVGSAGLAAHLFVAAGLPGRAGGLPTLNVGGPIVTVVGSLSSLSHRQAQVLEAQVELARFLPSPDLLRAGPAHPGWRALETGLHDALRAGRDVMLRIAPEEHSDLAQGHALCAALNQLLAPMAGRIGALVATGGETARGLLAAFGSHALQLVREIEPGIPLSVSVGARAMPIVTKAGAFGSPAALLHCYQQLAAIRRGPA